MELIDDEGHFYVYTDVGHKRDGVWTATGESWQKGVCIMQFNRSCPAGKAQARMQTTEKGNRRSGMRRNAMLLSDWLV